MPKWPRLTAELLAIRSHERKAWGNIDDHLLANYLAGNCDPVEMEQVEQWAKDFPQGAALVEALRDFSNLAEVEPAHQVWSLGKGASTLCGTLRAWRSKAGELVADGLREYQPTAFVGALMSRPGAVERGVWRLPLVDETELSVELQYDAAMGWGLVAELHSPEDEHSRAARLEVYSSDGELEFAQPLHLCGREPIRLNSGEWELRIEIGEQVFIVPVHLQN